MRARPSQGIRWEDFYAYQHYAQAGAARIARGRGPTRQLYLLHERAKSLFRIP